MASVPPILVTGTINSLEISGFGPNSSELVISIAVTGSGNAAYVMEFDAVPQMFAAATTMLTAAYHAKVPVTLVVPSGQPATATPKISGVNVPAI